MDNSLFVKEADGISQDIQYTSSFSLRKEFLLQDLIK